MMSRRCFFGPLERKNWTAFSRTKPSGFLSIEESLQFAKDHPEQIIESKFVDRFKPKPVELSTLEAYKRRAIQEGHLEAIELESDQQNPKSRLRAVGWHDPQIHEGRTICSNTLVSIDSLLSPTKCIETMED